MASLERTRLSLGIVEVLEFRRFPLQIVKRARRRYDGDDWLFEVKHDGFRVLAIRDGGRVRL
jgi:ATP-dependent DNA ligase